MLIFIGKAVNLNFKYNLLLVIYFFRKLIFKLPFKCTIKLDLIYSKKINDLMQFKINTSENHVDINF